MDLCDACETLAKRLSVLITEGHKHPLSGRSIRHGLDFCELDVSRATCRLCRLLYSHNPIAQSRPQATRGPQALDVSTRGYAIEISPRWDTNAGLNLELSDNASRGSSKLLRWLHIRVTLQTTQEETSEMNEKVWPVVLQIYGVRDGPAVLTGSLWNRYRFQSSGSKDAFSLLRRWLQNCLCHHERCKHDDFGNILGGERPRRLPTRVIDVGPEDNSRQPRLLITKGKSGSWIALSHCWGASSLQPPKTTQKNLEKHLQQISLDDLPKSFRDAVMVTRALNVRYLWIDSLCIVQDDREEWRRECGSMGHVYRDSLLTISAADATDCSQGFFSNIATLSHGQLGNTKEQIGSIDERLHSVIEAVELPYHCKGTKASFYISPKDDSENKPMESPLFGRGWVTQEWVLSRRTIIFLKDAMVWACREVQEDERGDFVKLRRPTILDWQLLIETYTRNRLTYESDRLAAIQGLATSLQGIRSDVYFAGMWAADLPDALLWLKSPYCVISEEFSYLPTWTWARTIGPVGFQLGMRTHIGGDASQLEDTSTLTQVGTSGSLEIRGLMRQVENVVNFTYKRDINVRDQMNKMQGNRAKAMKTTPKQIVDQDDDVEDSSGEMDLCFLKRCFKGQSNCRNSAFGSLSREGLSIVLKASGARVGWAAWDTARAPDGSIYCLGLKLERSCMHAILAIPESFVDAYHVLYLQREPLSTTRFVRVGMGVIMKDEWFENAPSCVVHLI